LFKKDFPIKGINTPWEGGIFLMVSFSTLPL
jgi:hypothetical protein